MYVLSVLVDYCLLHNFTKCSNWMWCDLVLFSQEKKTKRLDALHGQVNEVNIFTFSAANFFGEIREFRWDFSFSCTFSNG